MPSAADTYGTAFKHGTITCLARLVGWNDVYLVPADFNAASSSSGSSGFGVCDLPIKYTIYLLDEEDANLRTPVVGHTDRPLTPADVMYAALQTDSRWTVDSTGYNFAHTIDICEYVAFGRAGRKYLVEYVLTPAGAEHPIIVRFRINCI